VHDRGRMGADEVVCDTASDETWEATVEAEEMEMALGVVVGVSRAEGSSDMLVSMLAAPKAMLRVTSRGGGAASSA
jgi:hypothetical protein